MFQAIAEHPPAFKHQQQLVGKRMQKFHHFRQAGFWKIPAPFKKPESALSRQSLSISGQVFPKLVVQRFITPKVQVIQL